jgi:uncharacterized protein DUF1761
MLSLFWLSFLVIGACIILLMPLLLGYEFYQRYRGARVVTCPGTHQQVAVEFDAFHAAVTRLAGEPHLRLAECTRWPEHRDCLEECLPQARQVVFYTAEEAAPAKSKRIYHLPVLIAAFVAWVLGAVWHSHYLFRSHWMEAVSLNSHQVHQLVWRLAPHLLTVAVPLLFAYGVAWWLSWSDQKGVWRGVGLALLLWALLAGLSAALAGVEELSAVLLAVELAYSFLASALIGGIVGGLSGKLAEHKFAI